MAEHNDHGFMATKENAAPLKQATIDRALAMNEKSVSLPRDFKQDSGAACRAPREPPARGQTERTSRPDSAGPAPAPDVTVADAGRASREAQH